MTVYEQSPTNALYEPASPRSGRTIGLSIGRAVVRVVYAFGVAAIIIATLAFFLQLFWGQSQRWLRRVHQSQRRLAKAVTASSTLLERSLNCAEGGRA